MQTIIPAAALEQAIQQAGTERVAVTVFQDGGSVTISPTYVTAPRVTVVQPAEALPHPAARPYTSSWSGIWNLIDRSIARGHAIEIEYVDEDGIRSCDRRIRPREVRLGQNGPYIVAWDPQRQEPRNFRVERIKGVRPA